MTPTRKELESQTQDYAKKIANILKRKGEMEKELSQLAATAETRTQAIQIAMLENRDFTTDLSTQRSDKAKADSLTGAIAQAEKLLTEYQGEHESTQKKIGMVDFYLAADEVEKQMLICIKEIKEVFPPFDKAKLLFAEFQKVGQVNGISIDHETRAMQTSRVFTSLMFLVYGGNNREGISQDLTRMEEDYKNFIKEMRSKFEK